MRAVRRKNPSTFGAVGEEPKGGDLYIVTRDVTVSDNLGGTADITIRPFIGMSSFFTLRLKFIVYTFYR